MRLHAIGMALCLRLVAARRAESFPLLASNFIWQVKAFVELAASLLSTTGRPGRPGSQAAQQTAVSAEIVRAMKDAGARGMHCIVGCPTVVGCLLQHRLPAACQGVCVPAQGPHDTRFSCPAGMVKALTGALQLIDLDHPQASCVASVDALLPTITCCPACCAACCSSKSLQQCLFYRRGHCVAACSSACCGILS